MEAKDCKPGSKVKIPTTKNAGVARIDQFLEAKAQCFPGYDSMTIGRMEEEEVVMEPIGKRGEVFRFLPSDLEPYQDQVTIPNGEPDFPEDEPQEIIDEPFFLKPSHYNSTTITPFQVIDDWGLDFYLGNVVKYVARHQKKGNPKQDLLKAQEYLIQALNRLP